MFNLFNDSMMLELKYLLLLESLCRIFAVISCV